MDLGSQVSFGGLGFGVIRISISVAVSVGYGMFKEFSTSKV